MKKYAKIRNNFTKKLIIYFATLEIISIFAVAFIFYLINLTNMRSKVNDAIELTNRQIINQMDDYFRQMEQISSTLQYNMYSLPSAKQNSTAALEAYSTLRTNVNNLKNIYDFSHICVFIGKDNIYSSEGLMFFSFDKMTDFKINVNDLFRNTNSCSWHYVSDITYPFMVDKTFKPVSEIMCLRSLYNQANNQLEFAFFIGLDTQKITDLLCAAYATSNISGFLVEPSGMVIASSDSQIIQPNTTVDGNLYQAMFSNQTYETKSVNYNIKKLYNGWYYINHVSKSYIFTNMNTYISSFIVIMLLIVIATTFSIIRITNNMTKRIRLLSESASSVNFDQNLFHGSSVEYVKSLNKSDFDEIDHLAYTYNKMMETIYENIDKITQLHAQEASLKYRLLQSLINPHFLYNILDSIATCNRLGKPDLANKMIMNLTKFYRLTLRKSNELITIKDELEIATLYMELESICRGDNFTWSINMEEDIENFMICKFTLQPFIENCILHGMQGLNQQLHIQIDICYGEDTILIFITDNGYGIAPEKLSELQASLAAGEVDTSKHFGICNVNARISSDLFGHGFIEIDSSLGEGTAIKLEFAQILPD